VESLLGKAEVTLLQPAYRFEKAIIFYPTVGLPSNFFRRFRRPFSLE